MYLRLGRGASGASLGNDLAAAHLVAALDQDLLIMRVGRHPVVGVADQDEIAIALELVARIGHHAIFCRHHRGPLRHGEIDAVIVAAVRPGSEGRHDAALHRPPETIAGHRIWRGKLLVGGDTRRAHSWSAWTRGLVRCRDRTRRCVLLLAGIGALSLGTVGLARLL